MTWWGVGSAAAGVALVWVLMPADFVPAGALRSPALACAAALCAVPVACAVRSPREFFRAEHIVVMSPVYWLLLDPIQGVYPLYEITEREALMSFISVLLFGAAAWTGSGLASGRGPPRMLSAIAARELEPRVVFQIGVVAFVLAFLRFAIPSGFDPDVLLRGLTAGRWEAPWVRGALGGANAFVDHLVYFGYFLPALTVLMAQLVGWRNPRTIVLIVLSLVIAAFLAQGGDRRIVGVVLCSAGLLWLLGRAHIGARTLLIALTFASVVLLLLNTMLQYRNVGMAGMMEPTASGFNAPSGSGVAVRVDDNFLRLAEMIAIFPDRHPFTGTDYLVWVLARPVPRTLWPDKPLDPGFFLHDFKGMTGVSLSVSVIGELIMAGGMLAVALGGLAYGFIARKLTELLPRDRRPLALLVYSLGVLALFAGMRSMIELVLMSYGILALSLLVLLLQRAGSGARPMAPKAAS